MDINDTRTVDERLAAYRQLIRDHIANRPAEPTAFDRDETGEPCDAERDAMLTGDSPYGGRRGRYSA